MAPPRAARPQNQKVGIRERLLLDALSERLSFETKLCCLERVGLGHGRFRCVEAILNQPAKEWKANFSVKLEVLLALFVDQKQMVTLDLALATDIDIFSHFDITVGAENE
jgi:hypothetical protein